MPKTDAELCVKHLPIVIVLLTALMTDSCHFDSANYILHWPFNAYFYLAFSLCFRPCSSQAQKREMAGYKSVISNSKSTPEAKAVRTELTRIRTMYF